MPPSLTPLPGPRRASVYPSLNSSIAGNLIGWGWHGYLSPEQCHGCVSGAGCPAAPCSPVRTQFTGDYLCQLLTPLPASASGYHGELPCCDWDTLELPAQTGWSPAGRWAAVHGAVMLRRWAVLTWGQSGLAMICSDNKYIIVMSKRYIQN